MIILLVCAFVVTTYVDCQSFGVNGYNGFTGTVEYSDGTYENYVGGLLIGGKSKEGAYP